MNIYKLRKRYHKSDAEINSILSSNLEKLGNYAKFQYGAWEVDERGLSILDDIMGYKEPPSAPKSTPNNGKHPAQEKSMALVSKKEAKQSSPREKQDAEDEKDARIKQLREQVEEARNYARQYSNELDALQEKFISVQNGSDALNSSLIRKHQLRAEAAEEQLAKLQKDFAEKNRLKVERIKELEGRIEEMQSKLVENHDELEKRQQELFEANEKIEILKKDSTERCSQAELKVLNSKKNEDKLYRDLHKNEERISELNQKLITATNERMDAMQQMSSMRGQITDLKSQLIAIVAHLNEYLTDKETIPDVAGKTVEPPKEQTVAPKTVQTELPHPAPQPSVVSSEDSPVAALIEDTPSVTKPAPDITLSLQQQERMDRLRKQQQKEKDEKDEPKGFFGRILGKAAGLF